MDTAQAHLSPADPVNALNEAANVFKAIDNPASVQARDDHGRFAKDEPEPPADEPEDDIADADPPSADDVEEDDGQDDTDAAEADDADAQQDDVPMPTSWGTDDEAVWSALPAEAKAKIAEREAQRDAAVNLKFQESANARKAADAALAEANAARERHAQELDVILTAFQPQRPPRALLDPNSEHYNPDQYHMLVADYEAQAQAISELRQQREQIAAQQAREDAEQFARFEAEARPKLLQEVPDLADPVKAPAVLGEITQYGLAQGFTSDALQKATSTEVKILWEALQYRKSLEARKAVKPQLKKAAPVVKPGPVTSRHAVQKSNYDRNMQRLAKTGAAEDAAFIFKDMMKG